jgi:hypothetical protein
MVLIFLMGNPHTDLIQGPHDVKFYCVANLFYRQWCLNLCKILFPSISVEFTPTSLSGQPQTAGITIIFR